MHSITVIPLQGLATKQQFHSSYYANCSSVARVWEKHKLFQHQISILAHKIYMRKILIFNFPPCTRNVQQQS